MTEERKYILKQAGISVEEVLGRFMGNDALLERMLHKFLEDQTYAQLAEAMEQEDRDRAFQAAHTLKGVCGNLSMDRLFHLVSEQVELLRSGSWGAAQAMMPSVTRAYDAVCSSIGGN
ncbi:MAG TPA: Hpt domain-containing protein [Candidatus Onthovicinus excrementipullorum]|nr:Hpt domain-containing protein [Candidatus Onthovicinus excrementipullorum]